MADNDRLAASLQESILTLLSFVNEGAQVVAGLVTPALFEQPYYDIVERVLDFRKRFGTAPGAEHLDDLFSHVLEDPKNRKAPTYRRLLEGMLQQAEGINADYITSRTSEFVRRQHLKATVLRASQRYQEGGDDIADDVAKILFDGLKFRVDSLDPGTFLSDKNRSLSFLDNRVEAMPTGIKQLDDRQVGPVRGELIVFIAPRGRGKSWYCIHTGRHAMMAARAKVVHISLEMSEARLAQRYFQNIFAISKRDEEYNQTFFEFDELHRLSGFRFDTLRPKLNLKDNNIRRALGKLIDQYGLRMKRLVVKQFPTKALTMAGIRSYLDGLEHIHRFIPDVLMVDYPDLMATDDANYRISIGRLYEELRGLGVERNMAVVAPSQGNRDSETATSVGAHQVAEDISKVATADNIITYSQTVDERILGLARLFVSKVRNDEDKFTILITQNYKTGQFAIDSTTMLSNYWDQVKAEMAVRTGNKEAGDD